MESSPGIEKLKNGKACGLDGILNKFIKAGSELLLTMITQLFHSIWLTDLFPEKWSLGIINPIQAGLFCYHIGWEGHIVPPLRFSFICCPIATKLGMTVLWDNISQKQ